MSHLNLYDHQIKAVERMKNGCILNGGVGSGKSRTSLAYFFKECGGDIHSDSYKKMNKPLDLYIITTARKRDSLEWEGELLPFRMNVDPDFSLYKNQKIVIDSWNNIKKYANVKNAFFIFDEQRVVGNGTWVKTFIRIANYNKWILLSATPGDKWEDYIPVFIANGFYKNRTEFCNEHFVYSRFSKYPKVTRYLNTKKLTRLRDSILIDMDFDKKTNRIDNYITMEYDKEIYDITNKQRWNPYEEEPIKTPSELCYILRRIVNEDISRVNYIIDVLCKKYDKLIIFYNFNYELDILTEELNNRLEFDWEIAQWNGHKHEEVPDGKNWIYLVQYTAGCEAWNCIKTNCIVFYSQTYSYKILEQAKGRIDRLNTPFLDLYYYHLRSKAPIDMAISRTLKNKKDFNEKKYVKWE